MARPAQGRCQVTRRSRVSPPSPGSPPSAIPHTRSLRLGVAAFAPNVSARALCGGQVEVEAAAARSAVGAVVVHEAVVAGLAGPAFGARAAAWVHVRQPIVAAAGSHGGIVGRRSCCGWRRRRSCLGAADLGAQLQNLPSAGRDGHGSCKRSAGVLGLVSAPMSRNFRPRHHDTSCAPGGEAICAENGRHSAPRPKSVQNPYTGDPP